MTEIPSGRYMGNTIEEMYFKNMKYVEHLASRFLINSKKRTYEKSLNCSLNEKRNGKSFRMVEIPNRDIMECCIQDAQTLCNYLKLMQDFNFIKSKIDLKSEVKLENLPNNIKNFFVKNYPFWNLLMLEQQLHRLEERE